MSDEYIISSEALSDLESAVDFSYISERDPISALESAASMFEDLRDSAEALIKDARDHDTEECAKEHSDD